MLIRYLGHAMFELENAEGFRIVTDPFDETVGYPMQTLKADVVTVSHGHFDHNFTAACPGARVLDKVGEWCPAPNVLIRALASYHDEVQGQKRGGNLIFLYEIDGLRLCHLGDLGHPVAADLLGPVDVLMLPIGGTYTLDSREAFELAQAIKPKVILPMHYKTRVNADWAITGPEEFKALAGEGLANCPLLRITKEDIECCPPVVWLNWET